MSEPNVIDLSRPEVTVGYAMVGAGNDPFPSTVAGTERGAMVNALNGIFGVPVSPSDTDAVVSHTFKVRTRGRYRISAVAIEAVQVVQ